MNEILSQYKLYNSAYQYYYRNITKVDNDIMLRLEAPKDDFDWAIKIIAENLTEAINIESLLRQHETLENVYNKLKKLNGEISIEEVKRMADFLRNETTSKVSLIAKELLSEAINGAIDDKFIDLDFIRFQDCICCGLSAPQEGHLLQRTITKIKFPICHTCSRFENKVNYEKLCEIYYIYTAKIEKYMDRIRTI